MKWTILLCFPMAAVLAGTFVQPPHLFSPLDKAEKNEQKCSFEEAKRAYLEAYAWKLKSTEKALKLSNHAEQLLGTCHSSESTLRKRIQNLKRALSL